MTEIRPPTTRLVSAALLKAGLPKAQTRGSGRDHRVTRPGWHAWEIAGEVRVTYWGLSSAGYSPPLAAVRALERYAEVLEEAGWHVVRDGGTGTVTVLMARGGGSRA